MSNLQHRQSIIQEKRKKTPWRKFVMEICSRQPTMFYKNNGLVSTYPPVDRVKVTSLKESEKTITQELETKGNLFNDM